MKSDSPSNARPTLVFLHFFGGSGRSWSALIQILNADDWACLAPDLRGFGKSAVRDGSQFSVSEMADDVEDLIRGQAVESFVLVGHSMGGKVALALAARRPAGLLGCVLLAPSPPVPEPIPSAERARLLDGYGDAACAQETLKNITARTLPKEVLQPVILDILRTSPNAWRAWLENGSREDISDNMAHVDVPIAVGSADRSITRTLVESEICARLTGTTCSIVVLPAVGHLLPLEAPQATAKVITTAILQLPSRGHSL